MTPHTGPSRLLRGIRRGMAAVWRSTVDGLTATGAFYGALPPAQLAETLGHPLLPHRPECGPAPSDTGIPPHGPSDIPLTPAERRAWNQLVKRL
ncbi:hypothetical protein [Streptomyces sp. NPDC059063]|uniref:hypothetical protein n=1 Tax=unclassified Streptomyces TaxID=2593676 RepID=UPI0036B2EEFC